MPPPWRGSGGPAPDGTTSGETPGMALPLAFSETRTTCSQMSTEDKEHQLRESISSAIKKGRRKQLCKNRRDKEWHREGSWLVRQFLPCVYQHLCPRVGPGCPMFGGECQGDGGAHVWLLTICGGECQLTSQRLTAHMTVVTEPIHGCGVSGNKSSLGPFVRVFQMKSV